MNAKQLQALAAKIALSRDTADVNLWTDGVLAEMGVTDPNFASAIRAISHAILQNDILVRVTIAHWGQSDVIHFVRELIPPEFLNAPKTSNAVQTFIAGKGPMLVELTNGSAIEFVYPECLADL